MAAFDTPWLDLMSESPSSRNDGGSPTTYDPNPPTKAAFSPANLSHTSTKRSTVLVHQKSPLLLATPPQITRALAYSHPFLLPLNKFVGLLTWTSGDPWESFLLVAAFWAVTLYGDVVMRWAGPVVVLVGLILGMYSRRYSPLSSTGWTAKKQQPKKGHKKVDSEATNTKHQKTLDEIVETIRTFTARCNILLDPLLELTNFLSTQRTATTATVRPALTTLLIRILLVTPLWYLLTLPPISIITTRRIALVTGTIFFTWHSRPNRVARAVLWRSALIRQFCSAVTGLHLADNLTPPSSSDDRPPLPPLKPSAYQEASKAALAAAKRKSDSPGVRFTFILYENQRRWVGLGWTTSLFAYERAAWTDEYLNPASNKDDFELPDVDGQDAIWRWVSSSRWLVEGAGELEEGGVNAKEGANDGGQGWIYYDSKWQNGRRGQDGWGRYTRRRKWYRDAELVEVSPSNEVTPSPTPSVPEEASPSTRAPVSSFKPLPSDYATSITSDKASTHSSIYSSAYRFKKKRGSRASSMASDDEERPPRPRESDWGIGDDARMGLE